MDKVIVIGCPGSGKSTFSRALGEQTGLPLFHLDNLYWKADKTTLPKPLFRQALEEILKQERWIIDGNYGSTLEMRMQACDTVFFLDYPTAVCLQGVSSRKGKHRSDMPWIEQAGEEDGEFLAFIKDYRRVSRPVVLALLRKYEEKAIVVFKNREEAAAYLARRKEGASP